MPPLGLHFARIETKPDVDGLRITAWLIIDPDPHFPGWKDVELGSLNRTIRVLDPELFVAWQSMMVIAGTTYLESNGNCVHSVGEPYNPNG